MELFFSGTKVGGRIDQDRNRDKPDGARAGQHCAAANIFGPLLDDAEVRESPSQRGWINDFGVGR
jgi:hypothetical protein